MTTTVRTSVVLLASCALLVACGGGGGTTGGSNTCVDVDGTTWLAQITYTGSESVCSGSGTQTYSVAQTGCTGTLTVNGKALTGTITGNTVSWSGSYPYNSGTLTVTSSDVDIASDLKSASGSFNWSYSGKTTCTGTATFQATINPSSTAGNVALDVPASGSGGFNYTQGSYLEGFEFTANSAITVTALGAYDSNLSSLAGGTETFASVPVALYDMTTNTLVTSATVSASDPATGVYRYVTLASPVTLKTTDTYAVVWVSLANYYIASPTLAASAVNSAITYLAAVGHGTGGLTTTQTMMEPDWFFTMSDHGLSALNYDLGPNFMFQ